MGLVGYGRIGQAVGRIARAFGMHVIACDVNAAVLADADVEPVALEELLARSDVISLHCPLTADNERFINAERLARMKPTALLINAARGQLVNEPDLAAALDAGGIAGAAVDVLSAEPPPADNPLLTARNCVITPHIAWATRSARQRLIDTTIDNLRRFLAGTPVNVVS